MAQPTHPRPGGVGTGVAAVAVVALLLVLAGADHLSAPAGRTGPDRAPLRPAAPDVARPPAPASGAVRHDRPGTLSVATHNVRGGRGLFRPLASVIGWQESQGAALVALRAQLPAYDHYTGTCAGAGEDAISWVRDRFTLVGTGTLRTHGSCPGVSPNRYVTWVVLRDAGGRHLVLVNSHFVSGTRKADVPRLAWRLAMWRVHALAERRLVARLSATGYPVFVVGDFNATRTLPLRGVRRVHGRVAGIEQIYGPRSLPTPRLVRLGRHGSDHHAYRAVFTW